MNKNYKLYLKCILSNENYAFVSNLDNNVKNVNLLLTIKSLYYLTFHFRFSSLFYSSQLVDIFAYEIPLTSALNIESKKSNSSIVVYNFHILNTQNRFFFFTKVGSSFTRKGGVLQSHQTVPSIAELFFAANWLEREVSELHSLNFNGKKDLRNLMLQYGDSTGPFQKSFPSIGTKEMFYNPIKDTIIQNPVSLQI